MFQARWTTVGDQRKTRHPGARPHGVRAPGPADTDFRHTNFERNQEEAP